MTRDGLDEYTAERAMRDPEFPRRVAAEIARRDARRQLAEIRQSTAPERPPDGGRHGDVEMGRDNDHKAR